MKTELEAQKEQFLSIVEKENFNYLDKWIDQTQNLEPGRNILAWAVELQDIRAIDMIMQKGFYTVDQLGESLVIAEKISLEQSEKIMTFPLNESVRSRDVNELREMGVNAYDFLNIKLRNMEAKNPILKSNISSLRERYFNNELKQSSTYSQH